MALINCPECGKEISDQAKKCPSCGYKINTKMRPHLDKKKKALICIICGTILVLVGAFFIVYFTTIKPNIIFADAQQAFNAGEYDKALEECNKIPNHSGVDSLQDDITYAKAEEAYSQGDYDEAINILSSIPDYEGAEALKEEIINSRAEELFKQGKFETALSELESISDNLKANSLKEKISIYKVALEACKNLKSILKSPESLQLFEVQYAIVPNNNNSVVMIDSSGENGFGGVTRSYAVYVNGEYMGSCDSLEASDIDLDDLGEIAAWVGLDTYWDSEGVTNIEADIVLKAMNSEG